MSGLLDPSGRPLRSMAGPDAWVDNMVDDMLADDRDGTPGIEKASRKLASMVRGFRPHARDLHALIMGQPLIAGPEAEAFLRGMANVVMLTILLTRASERMAEAKAQESMGRDEPKEASDGGDVQGGGGLSAPPVEGASDG